MSNIEKLKKIVPMVEKQENIVKELSNELQKEIVKETRFKADKRELVIKCREEGFADSYLSAIIKINKGSFANMFRRGTKIDK